MTNKKKRFGGGSALVKGIVDTVRSGEQGEEGFNVEMLKLNRIKPDPKNPRLLGLTEDELSWLSNGSVVEQARQGEVALDDRLRTLLKLRDLADSISSNGVLQPIRLYRLGDEFRIESGERRYWGAILAKQERIPAIILQSKPARLRTFQLIENIQREDLTLSARIRNIASVVEELESEGEGTVLTASSLSDVIGTSRRQASKYLSVIGGHEEVMNAIASGVVDNLDTAVELGKIKTRKELVRAIKLLVSGGGIKQVKKTLLVEAKPKGKGRPAMKISLGATKNNKLVQHIMEKCLSEEALDDVDWSDFKSISIGWNAFLVKLEKKL